MKFIIILLFAFSSISSFAEDIEFDLPAFDTSSANSNSKELSLKERLLNLHGLLFRTTRDYCDAFVSVNTEARPMRLSIMWRNRGLISCMVDGEVIKLDCNEDTLFCEDKINIIRILPDRFIVNNFLYIRLE
jgi:hypothetical protein